MHLIGSSRVLKEGIQFNALGVEIGTIGAIGQRRFVKGLK